MAFEQFKTQVLLLHSRQSTLDALGAGFSDRYSVHFATSGSEALTTLGETPIHIIVSAQELPGMSGLEALREAKKRSPDTIGILLADTDSGEDLEAMVGDQEVFQIVRGEVQPDALLKIVENAARRMRMLTISRSANDNAANVDSSSLVDTVSNLRFPDDDGSGEHIVMETMENGTTKISDSTGRLPALKPGKIPVSPEVGGRAVDVLVLTKDSEFLNTVRESARGLHTVHHAVTGQQAQDAVRNNKVGVLVTDAAIAGNKVELLTQSLRAHSPRLVAIVAGRRDDGDSLMELINRGQVYRFLLKPVSPGRSRLAIEASVKYHLEAPEAAFKGVPKKAPEAPAQQAPAKPAQREPQPAKAPPPKAAPKAPAARKAAPAPRKAPPEGKRADPTLARTGRLEVPEDKVRATAGAPALDHAFGDDATRRFSPVVLGAAAAGLLAIAVGSWWVVGTSDDSVAEAPVESAPATADATSTPADPVTGEPAATNPAEPLPAQPEPAAAPATKPDPAYVALLDNARFARDSGRILAPPGDNAIEWYVAARETAPDNAIIREELTALIDQVLGMAEAAVLENRLADAREAIGMVELAMPQHPRIAFLSAQVDQIELRAMLDQARLAIREERFEDAAGLLASARDIPVPDASAIDGLAEELAEARSAQQVGDVLARADQRLAAGQLIAPANNNARYYFELALSNDPGNAAARQGLAVVASRLVLQARTAIDSGDVDRAAALLGDARSIDPDGSELAATENALAEAIAAREEAERQAAAERRAAERQAAEQRAAEARRRAAASATLSSGGKAMPATGGDPAPATGGAAPDLPAVAGNDLQPDGNPSGSQATGPAAEDAVPAAGDAEAVGGDAAPAAEAAGSDGSATVPAEPAEPESVAVSQLTRANYVAPRYPRNAQRRNVTGWVDISFLVREDGSVGDVTVLDSTPGSVFDDAATEAVAQWRFQPVVEGGRPVQKRVAVRLSFDLQ